MDVEIPPDMEMQVSKVNKVRRTRNGEEEVEVLKPLSFWDIVIDGA